MRGSGCWVSVNCCVQLLPQFGAVGFGVFWNPDTKNNYKATESEGSTGSRQLGSNQKYPITISSTV